MPWVHVDHPELLTACVPANVADAVRALGYQVRAVPWAGPDSVRVPLTGLDAARIADVADQLNRDHPQWTAEPEPGGGWLRVAPRPAGE